MFNNAEVLAMVPVHDIKKAEKFYSQTLELEKYDENPGGITYRCGATRLFVYPTPTAGTSQSTVATWEVDDINQTVKDLKAKGIKFEHYDYPGAKHEGDVHIWENMKAAWFKDPDGNTLGLGNKPNKK